MSEEKCLRCDDVGFDRRTLSMACLYDMSELGLPFDHYAIEGKYREQVGEKLVFGLKAPEYGESDGISRIHPFYSLRVCKNCRGDWMASIKNWFQSYQKEKTSCGSGIFIRENGAIIEITEEEWKRRNSPVRWRGRK